MWAMIAVAAYFLPLVMLLLVGIVLLLRAARKRAADHWVTGHAQVSRVLLASGVALWAGSVSFAVLTVAMVSDAFLGFRVVDRPFGFPLSFPMIVSFHPHRPSPSVLLVAAAVVLIGLALGAYALRRRSAVPDEAAVGYAFWVLKPVIFVVLGTTLFTVIWGLMAVLD